jgi:hypothetical protein
MTKICLIAGNSEEALQFAKAQNIPRESWFYPKNINDLLFRTNFYTFVIGTAGQNIPSSIFEEIYQTALRRGRIGRI